MRILLVLLFIAAASAGRVAKISNIQDCGVGNDITARFSGTVKTDPVPVPGRMFFDMKLDLSTDTTDNLNIRKTTIRTADNFRVPCLDGISGSCTLPLCFAIENFPDRICPILPPEIPCECPIVAGSYNVVDSSIGFDEAWLDPTVFPNGPDGNYVSKLEFVEGTQASSPVIGCVELEFTLTAVSRNS